MLNLVLGLILEQTAGVDKMTKCYNVLCRENNFKTRGNCCMFDSAGDIKDCCEYKTKTEIKKELNALLKRITK